jgi:hypothetical protein
MDGLRAIANAVLYEGYVLWPYRRSALKNTRRFTFGGVYPPGHSEAHPDDPSAMQTQVLVEGGRAARLDVCVRFLQVVRRQLYQGGEPVDELTIDGERVLSWDEATEREVTAEDLPVSGRSRAAGVPIAIAAGREEERAIVRTWHELAGEVAIGTEPVGDDVHRLTVRIENRTPLTGGTREAALERAFCSTHTILRVRDAALVSSVDPPEALRAQIDACRNEGTWPVLVGEPGDRHTMLSSPIILDEYPRVAPESPGDLFDGGEIDQLLTLISLTDEEKAEMRASDPRAREILERTEALSEDELMRLHGAIRDLRVARA